MKHKAQGGRVPRCRSTPAVRPGGGDSSGGRSDRPLQNPERKRRARPQSGRIAGGPTLANFLHQGGRTTARATHVSPVLRGLPAEGRQTSPKVGGLQASPCRAGFERLPHPSLIFFCRPAVTGRERRLMQKVVALGVLKEPWRLPAECVTHPDSGLRAPPGR